MQHRLNILILLTALLVCSCSRPALHTGDLVFVGIPANYHSSDSTSMSSAIADATGDGELNLIHVAILEVKGDSIWTIDATIDHGVDRHPLDTFFADFTLRDGSLPTFIIKRVKGESRKALKGYIANADNYLGEPYDNGFLPDNGAHYCTELVRDCYVTQDGEYLFDEAPMNFLDADGNLPAYWDKLFTSMGVPVPQGIPGTNPQDMSQSPLLVPVPIDLADLAAKK